MREGLTSDLPELHSTPWSSVQALDPAHPKAQEFVEQRSIRRGTSIELDLDTLLSQKYSGETDMIDFRSSALNPEEHLRAFMLKPVSLGFNRRGCRAQSPAHFLSLPGFFDFPECTTDGA